MSDVSGREKRHQGVLGEIHEERISALRRIGGRLEEILEELRALDGETGEEADARFDALVDRAELWRWYLVVTREAMGLLHHREVEEIYPIPRRRDRR